MLLDQDTLRFIFGVKLRALRSERGLSLKTLAQKTGLSPSYLNEIEKGKKYPKNEKILLLAEALKEDYETLVSLELKKDLQLMQTLLEKRILTGIPFDIFGIPSSTIFELLAQRPKKMRALVGTILELARTHNIKIDDLFFALMRSYLDLHQNYFPEYEKLAREFRAKHNLDSVNSAENLKIKLMSILKKDYKVSIRETSFQDLSPDLAGLSYFVSGKRQSQSLFISDKNLERETIFILARELGYHLMKAQVRPTSSLIVQLDSFDQLFHHFAASYFASSLLIPENQIIDDCNTLFKSTNWNDQAFLDILKKYPCTAESVFHRLTQILPRRFGINQLFFLRYEYDKKLDRYSISRELHLSGLHGPHRVTGNENYCSRWLIQKLTQSLSPFGIQRSQYSNTTNEYIILGSAQQKPQSERTVTSVCLGLLVNAELKEQIQWVDSASIPKVIVGETCERCAVVDCKERKAPNDPALDPARFDRILKQVSEFKP